jgi:hypothetical protein
MVYPALLLLMRTSRLPVVDWTDVPADLNGLVRFAERRNVVSAREPSHFKRSLQLYCFFNLGARWECVVKGKPWLLYPRERKPVPLLQKNSGPQARPGRLRNISRTGIRFPNFPARSEWLYWGDQDVDGRIILTFGTGVLHLNFSTLCM